MCSWHAVNVQHCAWYQNSRQHGCMMKRLPGSKDRSISEPDLEKGSAILCLCVDEGRTRATANCQMPLKMRLVLANMQLFVL